VKQAVDEYFILKEKRAKEELNMDYLKDSQIRYIEVEK